MFRIKTTFTLLFALSLNAAAGGAAPTPRTISLERDCNGCTTGARLTLYADGRAQLATLGKARLGTVDELREGRLSPTVFADLVRLAKARNFFKFDDDLADPEQQDGPWLTLRIECSDGQAKQVFSRGAQPPALAELVDAIDAAGRQIAFNNPPK